MDDIVRAAMQKWPNVPACYGWLALDVRGDWYLRDDQAQAAGPFPRVKGSRIQHVKLREFIERNYQADGAGRWLFQNGPQCVYVELEAAPWVWRLPVANGVSEPGRQVEAHTGQTADVQTSWLDEHGRLFLATKLGLGIVHTQDMLQAAGLVESGAWVPQDVEFAELPARFGFCLHPHPQPAPK